MGAGARRPAGAVPRVVVAGVASGAAAG